MSSPRPIPPLPGWKDPYRAPRRLPSWVVALLLVLLLYLLSVGPACRLAQSQWVSWPFLQKLYAPIIWAAETPLVHTCLQWYVRDLWRVKGNRLTAPTR